MNNKWDIRFLELAKHIAQWSKDPSTKVGAVVVDENRIVVGMGYNGFARGVNDIDERLLTRSTKYKYVVHAEVNALIAAGHAAKGCSLYVWPTFSIPNICHDCAKTAIQYGILEVVGFSPDSSPEQRLRWEESINISKEMLDEAGVFYRAIHA